MPDWMHRRIKALRKSMADRVDATPRRLFTALSTFCIM